MFQIRKCFLPLEAQFTQINFFMSNFLIFVIQGMDIMHQSQIICARIKALQALPGIFKRSRYPRTHPIVSQDTWSRVFWYRGLDLKLRSIWYRKNEQYKYCIDLKCGKYIFQIISVWFSQLSITILMSCFQSNSANSWSGRWSRAKAHGPAHGPKNLRVKAHGPTAGPKIFQGQRPWSSKWSRKFLGSKTMVRQMVPKILRVKDHGPAEGPKIFRVKDHGLADGPKIFQGQSS